MKQIKSFDFGNCSVPTEKPYMKVERVYKSPRFMWVTEVKNRWREVNAPTPLKDYLYGQKGEFRVGLPLGNYQLKLFFFDPLQAWPEFKISFGGVDANEPAFSGKVYKSVTVTMEQNVPFELIIKVEHIGGPLAISFEGLNNNGFMVNGLQIFGDKLSELVPMYKNAPSDILPLRQEVEKNGCLEPQKALERTCNWLERHRLADGFLGDFEFNQRLWYTSSYPIRTLLAGYRLLGRQSWLEIAIDILDLFVDEQMPEGAFTQSYRQKKTACMTPCELEEVRHRNWMNLADVGSMVAALTTAIPCVDGERKKRYTDAVRKYIDCWAIKYRHENGGFTNGWILKPADKVYSVSTATTALTAALFFRLTGEKRYINIANDATMLLSKDWNEDGRNLNWIFDGTFPGHNHYQETTEFGDVFYTMETISAVMALTEDDNVKRTLFEALRKYLFGDRGLLAKKGDRSWWELQNTWNNSKSAGNPILLLDFLTYGKEYGATSDELERVKYEYELCGKFLCTPEYSAQLGVLLDDPTEPLPFTPHGLQSWTGCAVAAAGFSGITFAQMTQTGIIYSK